MDSLDRLFIDSGTPFLMIPS